MLVLGCDYDTNGERMESFYFFLLTGLKVRRLILAPDLNLATSLTTRTNLSVVSLISQALSMALR